MEHIWLSYIIHFVISIIAGSLFCIGLFQSAQGESSIKPDGSESTDWGMIFYPITKFLSRKNYIDIFYIGWQLEDLYNRIKCDFRQHSDVIEAMGVTEREITIGNPDLLQMWEMLICDIKKKYKIEGYIQDDRVLFYETYEQPVFGGWRKPLLLCYKCYASIWGTIIFILMSMFSIKTGLIPQDFYILIPMWIIYVFSLVVANMYLEKKVRG